jgi:diacylglycerol O-acyltransferase / wax synthase
MKRIERLSRDDEVNLAVEAADTPMHQAALGILDAAGLLDSMGHLRLDAIRDHVEARLDRVPELRRVLLETGPLQGRPLWVDDSDFRIDKHVLATTLPDPGGEKHALAFAARMMSELMDRSRPLWEVWFLEGYAPGEVGIFIKLHHAVADGRAMINLIGQVFDLEARHFEQPSAIWHAEPPPSTGALVADNLQGKLRSLGRLGMRTAHPARLWRSARKNLRGMGEALRAGRRAPRTSLNRPIGTARRLATLRFDLAEVKAVAHRHNVKLNDVFQCIVAGGLRGVLRARGEDVRDVGLHASIAVSMHPSDDSSTVGNHVGNIIVRLPLDREPPSALLAEVARSAARAKSAQRAVITPGLMVLLARSGLMRVYLRHQHIVNVLTTNLPGPPVALYFAGARLRDAMAIPPIAGNVTVSFAALSYAGRLNVTLVADGDAWPDLEVLRDAMAMTWKELESEAAFALEPSSRLALSA